MGNRVKRRTAGLVRIILATALLFWVSSFPFHLFPYSPRAFAVTHDAVISTETVEGRLAVFDDAWERINERYYDRQFNGLDWDTQRTTFRPLAEKATSGRELYAVLRRMISSLKDPHTRVFAPEEKFDWWRPRFVTMGLTISEVGGLPTVTRVERESAPQKAGIRPGDVIETVDREAASALLQRRLTEVADPVTAATRYRVFAKLLDGPDGSSVALTWKDKSGKRKSHSFARYWQQRELGVRIRRERDFAVVEIEAFTKPIALAFARDFKEKFSGVRGVIIDLRTNGGGDAEAMSDIASIFLGVNTDLGRFTDRAGTSFTLSTRFKSLLAKNPVAPTGVPLVVLTSERTASAAEIFVEALRDSKRATIIGTETCGCVLAVRTRHVLPDGGLLDVSELDYETAQGQRIEGHGLKPDENVTIERKDLYAGWDRAIELAKAALVRVPFAQFQ
ncbi:MAG TPA: S41 family peptidase [Pyrinomonadaceae bacterium]|nr:S41 family peptidase [Pyrinomonadaceae bacterium]